MRVGVLAVQGDFEAHARAVASAGRCVAVQVRLPRDLRGLDALILPGGESTTISKGLARTGLDEALREAVGAGLPTLGTCAGAILLSRDVEQGAVSTLGVLDVTVARNAYGTQVDSFATEVDDGAHPDVAGLRAVFIRAPRFVRVGRGVEVLARVAGDPVLLRRGPVVAATFHPELGADPRVHRLLLAACRGSR